MSGRSYVDQRIVSLKEFTCDEKCRLIYVLFVLEENIVTVFI